MRQTLSPTGRYETARYEHEVFNSHWVDTPTLLDKQTGETLLAFTDTHWSLDDEQWLNDSQVRWTVRKYPGNHRPNDLVAIIDCTARTASLREQPCELQDLEPMLDGALTWIYAEPPDPRAPLPGWRGWLRRMFKGY